MTKQVSGLFALCLSNRWFLETKMAKSLDIYMNNEKILWQLKKKKTNWFLHQDGNLSKSRLLFQPNWFYDWIKHCYSSALDFSSQRRIARSCRTLNSTNKEKPHPAGSGLHKSTAGLRGIEPQEKNLLKACTEEQDSKRCKDKTILVTWAIQRSRISQVLHSITKKKQININEVLCKTFCHS